MAGIGYSPLLEELIRTGECCLYHDYRRGSFSDLSIYGNDGVPTSTVWGGGGITFPLKTSLITVVDSPELQLTEGTLVVFAEFLQQGVNERLVSKRDGGGTNYDFLSSSTDINLYDGTVTRSKIMTTPGKKYIAVNFSNGEVPESFVDGLSDGMYIGASTISVNDALLIIGNRYNGGRWFLSPLWAILIINRQLTATEHSIMYSELNNITWQG